MNAPLTESVSLYKIIQGNDPIRGTFMRYLSKIADFQGVFNIETNNFPVDSLSNLRQIVSVTFAMSRYYMPDIKRGNIFMRDNVPFMIGTVQFLDVRKTHCKCLCYSTELSLTV